MSRANAPKLVRWVSSTAKVYVGLIDRENAGKVVPKRMALQLGPFRPPYGVARKTHALHTDGCGSYLSAGKEHRRRF